MVAAGLDVTLVISKIQKSKCDFQTDPDTLIQLKQAGISAAVLNAMMQTDTSMPPANEAPKMAEALPTGYGFYLFNGEHHALQASSVNIVFGLTIGPNGYAVDGFAGKPPQTFSAASSLLVYQQNVDVSQMHLAQLEFIGNMRAFEFNMGHTNPTFFAGIYGVDYNQVIAVNLWRPQVRDVQVHVEPVNERQGMYRIVPVSPLSPGKYALFFGSAIHDSNTIYATPTGTTGGAALYFEIRPLRDSRNSTCATFEDCFQIASGAFAQKDWESAKSFTERAISIESDRPESYAMLGTIYLYKNDFGKYGLMWDKALQLGGTLQWTVCHERALDCERGVLTANKKEVRFINEKGKVAFNVVPSEVTPAGGSALKIGHAAFLRVKVNNKNYNLYFWPDDVDCAVKGMYIECDGMGFSQQAAMANYIIKRVAMVHQ